jgi:hypothetical protein
LDDLLGPGGITLEQSGTAISHEAHFSSASQAELGGLVGTLAATAGDFNAVSTTPGFTYTYNPELKVFERSARNLGPVFLERAETVGRGRFDIGVSYLYVDFTKLNGNDLDHLNFTLSHDPFEIEGDGSPSFTEDTIRVQFTKFTLRSHVVPVYGTFGITDNWDVNLVIPVVQTDLDARATATIMVSPDNTDDPGAHRFPGGGLTNTYHASDSKTGVGDILLRTKYRFTDSEGFNFAGGLGLRFPSGSKDDFQGIGDYTLTPAFIVSRLVTIPILKDLQGPHDFHLNAGIETNVEHVSQSRARYGAGVTWRILERLAILTDVIGSSGLADTEVKTTVTEVSNELVGINVIETKTQKTFTRDVRTDLVDFHAGLKFNLYAGLIGHVGAIIPLNNDGLRTNLTPTGGFEYDF